MAIYTKIKHNPAHLHRKSQDEGSQNTHRKSMVLVHSKVLGRCQPLASQLQGCCPSIGDKLLQQERPGVKDSVPLAFQTAMEVNNREGMPSSH